MQRNSDLPDEARLREEARRLAESVKTRSGFQALRKRAEAAEQNPADRVRATILAEAVRLAEDNVYERQLQGTPRFETPLEVLRDAYRVIPIGEWYDRETAGTLPGKPETFGFYWQDLRGRDSAMPRPDPIDEFIRFHELAEDDSLTLDERREALRAFLRRSAILELHLNGMKVEEVLDAVLNLSGSR